MTMVGYQDLLAIEDESTGTLVQNQMAVPAW